MIRDVFLSSTCFLLMSIIITIPFAFDEKTWNYEIRQVPHEISTWIKS
jgi:hypothetical protein